MTLWGMVCCYFFTYNIKAKQQQQAKRKMPDPSAWLGNLRVPLRRQRRHATSSSAQNACAQCSLLLLQMAPPHHPDCVLRINDVEKQQQHKKRLQRRLERVGVLVRGTEGFKSYPQHLLLRLSNRCPHARSSQDFCLCHSNHNKMLPPQDYPACLGTVLCFLCLLTEKGSRMSTYKEKKQH